MVYDKISLVLFVNSYMLVMEVENLAVRPHMVHHLQEVMSDTELYGWERVCVFHAVWLQQL